MMVELHLSVDVNTEKISRLLLMGNYELGCSADDKHFEGIITK